MEYTAGRDATGHFAITTMAAQAALNISGSTAAAPIFTTVTVKFQITLPNIGPFPVEVDGVVWDDKGKQYTIPVKATSNNGETLEKLANAMIAAINQSSALILHKSIPTSGTALLTITPQNIPAGIASTDSTVQNYLNITFAQVPSVPAAAGAGPAAAGAGPAAVARPAAAARPAAGPAQADFSVDSTTGTLNIHYRTFKWPFTGVIFLGGGATDTQRILIKRDPNRGNLPAAIDVRFEFKPAKSNVAIVLPAPPQVPITANWVDAEAAYVIAHGDLVAVARELVDEIETMKVGVDVDNPLTIPTTATLHIRPHGINGPEVVLQDALKIQVQQIP